MRKWRGRKNKKLKGKEPYEEKGRRKRNKEKERRKKMKNQETSEMKEKEVDDRTDELIYAKKENQGKIPEKKNIRCNVKNGRKRKKTDRLRWEWRIRNLGLKEKVKRWKRKDQENGTGFKKK